MRKTIALFAIAAIIAGCGKIEYKEGMYSDVTDSDYYHDAVVFCVNESYMVPEGDMFGAADFVSLSECADITAKITGKGGKNAVEYVIKNNIAPYDFGEWDAFCTREDAAYMLAKIAEGEEINSVIEGAIADVSESYAKDEIYKLYRMGILSGDGVTAVFRPKDYMTNAEMAIVVDRICNEENRLSFDRSRLEVSFVAFGDTIGHTPVIKSGEKGGGYDFSHLFENVEKYVQSADVACINQETVFTEGNFSGYPSFGSPKEIGVAEFNAGFDVICQATNHAFDRGSSAILYTTDFWDGFDVKLLGIHQSQSDADKIEVIEKNGIKIALLNYTYSLNGYTLPKGKEYMVDLLDTQKIKADMEKARAVSDAIVVFAHWGNEYQNSPDIVQRQWAQLFIDLGATVIVGHHPHVVQPLEAAMSSDGRIVPVYYSLGNFISNQNDYQNALCAMADFKIVKDLGGVRCEEYKIEPVVTHMENGYYSAYLLEDYTEEMARRHKHRGKYGNKFSVEAYNAEFEKIVK